MTERWKEIEDEIQREAYGSSDYGQTLRHFHTPVHRDYRKIAAKRIAMLEEKVSHEMMDAEGTEFDLRMDLKRMAEAAGLDTNYPVCADDVIGKLMVARDAARDMIQDMLTALGESRSKGPSHQCCVQAAERVVKERDEAKAELAVALKKKNND